LPHRRQSSENRGDTAGLQSDRSGGIKVAPSYQPQRTFTMRALLVPLSACLLLSGCALPLIQAAGTQMMTGTQMMPNTQMMSATQTTPNTLACGRGTACPDGIGTQIAKGVGASFRNLTGLASADQPPAK
jgi:hypothetical protein